MCNHPLDAQARGSMCSHCWMRYVRSYFDSAEDVRLVRSYIRTVQGSGSWYLPDDTMLATSHEEVQQLTMF